jgi:hypothetical protein
MSEQTELPSKCRPSPVAMKANWLDLCEQYLPVNGGDNSVWRYSREWMSTDQDQGWKLHISSTILTANRILKLVAPFLSRRNLLYKAPKSLSELDKLNSGIFYRYSQVGKVLTIYPRSNEEAVLLARKLYSLTRRIKGPAIPFDSRYRPDGCVYYRYGGFRSLIIEGKHLDAIRDPAGNLVLDKRDSTAKPDWVIDPFIATESTTPILKTTPLLSRFKAFRALTQRGKGGVYQALDLNSTPPRLCILKEGRRYGEVDWEGRDGFWRVKHEERVLTLLREAGINVPTVYSSFKADKNYYVAIECIEGEDLRSWLERKQRRISIAAALKRAAELARIICYIHAAGWVWRDCKPANLIIDRNGELRPLDFEGACQVNHPDSLPWGTPSFIPPEANDAFRGQSRLPEDLYALGAVIHLLLTGRTPDAASSLPLSKLRRGIPRQLSELVTELLDTDPAKRPDAKSVAIRLENLAGFNQGRRLALRASSLNLGSARRSAYRGSVVRKAIEANRDS